MRDFIISKRASQKLPIGALRKLLVSRHILFVNVDTATFNSQEVNLISGGPYI